ncbi:phospholipid carrier-dependent glycosyltransferase [Bradyrhizobium sp. STM 3557]|uniref:phospholipid carrier-dependent glycosyltransferase n=1 Tax=Bradyrhizobium sp. STM 3557 TaxID=578920 RepID=UPI003890DDBB
MADASDLRPLSAWHSTLIALFIFIVAHAALLVRLSTPEKFVFDEVHYVPAARQILLPAPSSSQLNPMHPPLGKQLIALSIRSFGDNAFGWRYASTVFGALAVMAIYLCGLALFAAQGPAIAAAAIALFNQMLFVQARVAMLDVFATGFSLLAIAAFMHGFRRQRPQLLFAMAGICFGLAIACKWCGVFPWVTALGIAGIIRMLQHWQTSFADPEEDDWYSPELWPELSAMQVVLCLGVIPVVCYVATFIVLEGWSPVAIAEAQRRIFDDSVTMAIAGHTYMSAWPSWPFLVRPVWFLFDKTDDQHIAAVVLLGNPLVLWPGLLALLVCVHDFIAMRRRAAFLIAAFYVGCYLPWALLPRALSFLYYYLPSAMLLSLALPCAWLRWHLPPWVLWAFVMVAAVGFVAMLPISAAFVGTSMATFNRLMLFQSWI